MSVNNTNNNNTYPPEFDCPITMGIMSDPVMDNMGMTFDRSALMKWLGENQNRHPIIQGRTLMPEQLQTNYALKSQIERYLATNPVSTVSVTTAPFVQKPLAIQAIRFSDPAPKLSITVSPPSGERQPVVMLIALDNSGSMGENATEAAEGGAFTRMDLCKHTLRTIAGMLGDNDILCLTTFSTTAKVVMKPTLMTKEGKAKLESIIPAINPDANTNIWGALQLINRLASSAEFEGRNIVSALLTDGMPNVDPPRGILNHYKELKKPSMFSLSTFGFGYNLDSKLLSELAELGNGSFGFIPDYSMVATVFINWAATVLSTAATNQTLILTRKDGSTSCLETGLVQLEQSRSFVIPDTNIVSITHNGTNIPLVDGRPSVIVSAKSDLIDAIKICILNGGPNSFENLYRKYIGTDGLEVLCDIKPSGDPTERGQVIMAPDYYQKWGKHYLRAYLRAQEQEQCMNFKDMGLQRFGGSIFHALQKDGDDVFASLPPLEASGYKPNSQHYGGGAVQVAPVNMGTVFNNPRGGCFAPGTRVKIITQDSTSYQPIETLRRGNIVYTPSGPAQVEYLVEIGFNDSQNQMSRVGNLLITPWHPINQNGEWVYPANIYETTTYNMPKLYNLILSNGHVVEVNGVLSCTLGHGIRYMPVIGHPYFSNKSAIINDLSTLPGFTSGLPVFTNLVQLKHNGLVYKWINE